MQEIQKYAQGFIERHEEEYLKVNSSLVKIAENAKRNFINEFDNKYRNNPLRSWLDNTITLQTRPGGIKSYTSLDRKLRVKFSDASEPFWQYVRGGETSQADAIVMQQIRDIAGLEVRLPCGRFLEDFIPLISEAARKSTSQSPETSDTEKLAKSCGYRGKNIKVRVGALCGEIQVKTHLTKSWDYYSHDLFYNSHESDELIPTRLKSRLNTLSSLLAVCEDLSDDVIAELLDHLGDNRPLFG
ncbi:MAG TPA: hypothetical protein PKV55_15015 [Nitrospira sp.]|nr:hypothetical protein [Nitrospira sp.]